MLPTPSTAHINYDQVYEPAEDSFLFLDLLSSPEESGFLKKRFQVLKSDDVAPLVVEVGVGSGVVLAFITANTEAILGHAHALTLGTDLNPFACESASQTVKRACDETSPISEREFLGTIRSDLAVPLRQNQVDILIFNPPYVPSEILPSVELEISEMDADIRQRDSVLLSLSYEGGSDGMEVTQRLLDQLPFILNKDRGVAYILLCQQNKPGEVAQRLRRSAYSWDVDVVARSGMKAGWEKLQILRISVHARHSEASSSGVDMV